MKRVKIRQFVWELIDYMHDLWILGRVKSDHDQPEE